MPRRTRKGIGRNHALPRPFVCSIPGCNEAYMNETGLWKHTRMDHSTAPRLSRERIKEVMRKMREIGPTDGTDQFPRFKCPGCHKTYEKVGLPFYQHLAQMTNAKNLENHLRLANQLLDGAHHPSNMGDQAMQAPASQHNTPIITTQTLPSHHNTTINTQVHTSLNDHHTPASEDKLTRQGDDFHGLREHLHQAGNIDPTLSLNMLLPAVQRAGVCFEDIRQNISQNRLPALQVLEMD